MKYMQYILWLVGLMLILGSLATWLMQFIPGLFPAQEAVIMLNGFTPQVMRVQLALQTLSMFFIPAIAVYIMMLRSDSLGQDLRGSLAVKGHLWGMLLAAGLSFLLLPTISLLGAWNASWPLPEWSLRMERQAKFMTDMILMDSAWSAFATNIFVCAFLPALAEELFFRGVLQSIFIRTLKNPHVAIWVVAAVFSFFHFQFAGFVPRLVLGLLMGYLFYYGNSLALAIIAHFANNAVAVFAYFITTRYASAGVSPQMFDKYLEGFGILHVISMLLFAFLSFVFLRKIYLKS